MQIRDNEKFGINWLPAGELLIGATLGRSAATLPDLRFDWRSHDGKVSVVGLLTRR